MSRVSEVSPFRQGGSYQSIKVVERICSQNDAKELDLSLCDLGSVPLDAIQVYHGEPTGLDLSHNLITCLGPKFMDAMAHLTKLDLSKNRITRLPTDFGRLRKLTYLDLHCNLLESLPVSMTKLSHLKYLNTDDNPFGKPLSTFLEFNVVNKKREDYIIDGVHPVILFLGQFVTKLPGTDGEGEGDTASRQKSVTFDTSGIHDRYERMKYADSDDDENMKKDSSSSGHNNRQRRKRTLRSSRGATPTYSESESPREVDASPVETPSGWMRAWKAFVCLVFLLLLTPIMLSVMVDYDFFDGFAKDSAGFWALYNTIHYVVSGITRCHCNLNVPLTVQAPFPEPGILASILETISRFVSNAFEAVAFWK